MTYARGEISESKGINTSSIFLDYGILFTKEIAPVYNPSSHI